MFEEEADDLVRSYETALKRRRRGVAIHLSVDAAMPDDLRALVVDELEVDDHEIPGDEVLAQLNEDKQRYAELVQQNGIDLHDLGPEPAP